MEYNVYILRSQKDNERIYIGYTQNLKNRLEQHSQPKPENYTLRYAPWKLETYLTFTDEELAQQFETYLKSQSGRAFLRKRLIP